MNTYPAFYPNFGTTNTTTNAYSNPYSPPYGYNQQAPQMTQFSVPQSQPPMMTVIGKAVENKDMVSVADVPMGDFGIFPKTDLSEIYIKKWNGQGKTDIILFKPVAEKIEDKNKDQDIISQLMQKIDRLEAKIDNLNAAAAPVETLDKNNENINCNF